MRYKNKCDHCSHETVAYTIPMNASKIKAFIKFAEKAIGEGNKGITKGEIGLSNAQYSNFQNLRYFGIIEQYQKGNKWYITKKGLAFYNRSEPLYTPIAQMGGEVLGNTHEAWRTHSTPRQEVFINDFFPVEYKTRDEYAEEKSSQEDMGWADKYN